MSAALTKNQKKINLFRSQSEYNYIFACQAAVPLVLTTDLLYQLWNNFKHYSYIFDLSSHHVISHIAISDLIQSPLCREVGYQLYEIEKDIRDMLLSDLVSLLGEKRKNTIAAFLLEYADLEYPYSHRKHMKSLHKLTANSILNPAEMEKQIIENINKSVNDYEKIRQLQLHNSLKPANYNSELSEVSDAVVSLYKGNELSPILIAEKNEKAEGVLSLVLPHELRRSIQYIKGVIPSKINGTIQKVIKDESNRLDLSDCELYDLDNLPNNTPFHQIEELIISDNLLCNLEGIHLFNNLKVLKADKLGFTIRKAEDLDFIRTRYPDFHTKLIRETRSIYFNWDVYFHDFLNIANINESEKNELLYSQKRLDKIFIKILIQPIAQLVNITELSLQSNRIDNLDFLLNLFQLEVLDLKDNDIEKVTFTPTSHRIKKVNLSKNQLTDIFALSKLTGLIHLDLRNNQITDISSLQYLTQLTRLTISSNQIADITPLKELIRKGLPVKYEKYGGYGIYLLDNPLDNLPIEVVKQGNEAILNYWESQISYSINEIEAHFALKLSRVPLKEFKGNSNSCSLNERGEIVALSLNKNNLIDISFLSNFNTLTDLDLSDNQITDISPLYSLVNLTVLALNGNQIQYIPPLQSLVKLTVLSINHNKIQDISPLQSLVNLTVLWLSFNQIQDISPLQNLRNLKVLNLSTNKVSDITPLSNLINLERLSINQNKIRDIIPLSNLIRLETLHLGGNFLDGNCKSIESLISLKELGLGGVNLHDISFLRNLKNLRNLKIDYNNISEINPILTLTNLENLNINTNNITHLPHSFLTCLPNLKSLNIQKNLLYDIPEYIYGQINCLKDLKEYYSLFSERTVNLSGKQIRTIPEELRNNKLIEELDVSNNQIAVLPEWISELTTLKRLILRSNKIENLPNLNTLADLQFLDLGHNALSVVNNSFSGLSKLQYLILERNFIENADFVFNGLHNLKYLYFASNKLKKISDNIGECKELIGLYVDNNKLSSLPEALKDNINLSRICLHNNEFSEFPSWLFRYKNITTLDYKTNKILNPDKGTLYIAGNPAIEVIPAHILAQSDVLVGLRGYYEKSKYNLETFIESLLYNERDLLISIIKKTGLEKRREIHKSQQMPTDIKEKMVLDSSNFNKNIAKVLIKHLKEESSFLALLHLLNDLNSGLDFNIVDPKIKAWELEEDAVFFNCFYLLVGLLYDSQGLDNLIKVKNQSIRKRIDYIKNPGNTINKNLIVAYYLNQKGVGVEKEILKMHCDNRSEFFFYFGNYFQDIESLQQQFDILRAETKFLIEIWIIFLSYLE